MKLRIIFFLVLIFAVDFYINAQVGINQSNPHVSAAFDIYANNKGILIPRMTLAQRNAISSPATGLLIFQTNNSSGFYHYNGTAWVRFNINSSQILDNDGDTGLYTEKDLNDNKILFRINGSDRYVFENIGANNNFRVRPLNLLNNIFIGKEVGKNNLLGSNNVCIGDSAFFNGTSSYNIALGNNSLFSNAAGTRNTAVGNNTLKDNVVGNDATAIGHEALQKSTQSNNTAIGLAVMKNMSTGNNNTAIGARSMEMATSGFQNTAIGYKALFQNTLGSQNTTVGFESMMSNTIGIRNTAFGSKSLRSNMSGNNNSSFGYQTLMSNTVGSRNTAVGANALKNGTTGSDNVGIGYIALQSNVSGSNNTAIGTGALSVGTVLEGNTAVGVRALRNSTIANNNTAIGYEALNQNTIGNRNTAIGYRSLYSNITGNGNTGIGSFTDVLGDGYFNSTAIGYKASINANNVVSLGSVAGENGATTSAYLQVNANNISGVKSLNKFGNNGKGMLIPRMTNAQRDSIANPAEGLMVYSLSNHHFCFFNGTNWENMNKMMGPMNAKNGESFIYLNDKRGIYPGYSKSINGLNQNFGSEASVYQDENSGTFTIDAGLIFTISRKFGKTRFKFVNSGSNVFFGRNSGESFFSGYSNICFGSNAMKDILSGSYNVAIGSDVMLNNTYSDTTIAVGYKACDGFHAHTNIGIGAETCSGQYDNSIAIGHQALTFGSGGSNCVGLGAYTKTNGSKQCALGARANVTSSDMADVVLGAIAGQNGATQSTSVGIGTTTPDAMLHIKGSGDLIILEDETNNFSKIRFKNNFSKFWDVKATMTNVQATTDFDIQYNSSSTTSVLFNVNANSVGVLAGILTENSDSRLKKNIIPVTQNLSKINKLRGVTYYWKYDKELAIKQYGLIAQELEKVYPELVAKNGKYKSINYSGLNAVLLGATNELREKIEKQEATLMENERLLSELEAMLGD